MEIKETKQISTKSGDKGSAKDYSNREFKKNNILFEILGTIDELSSYLGLAYHFNHLEDILVIQKELQKINSLVATDPQSALYGKLQSLNSESAIWLEEKMQMMLDKKPLEPRFTLPGSEKSLNGAYIDLARAICRRAERRLTEFVETNQRDDLDQVQIYINRLSDYLYILSCNLE